MAYNETLAARIRATLGSEDGISERKMFGGLCFMRHGHMFVGIVGDELMARLGSSESANALTRPGVREMDFTGRPMQGYVFIAGQAFATEAALSHWLRLGLRHADGLPPK